MHASSAASPFRDRRPIWLADVSNTITTSRGCACSATAGGMTLSAKYVWPSSLAYVANSAVGWIGSAARADATIANNARATALATLVKFMTMPLTQ